MKTIRILKNLSIRQITWKNKSGTNDRWQAQIWQPKIKKYAWVVLKDDDGNPLSSEESAKDKAVMLYSEYQKNLQTGMDVSRRRKNVPFLIEEFLKSKQKDIGANFSARRHEVLTQLLKSFEEHWSSTKKRNVDDYIQNVYELEFRKWRREQPRKGNRWKHAINKPLTINSLNSELNAHKQFINWCIRFGYAARPLELRYLDKEQTVEPFPRANHKKLLSAIRKDIEDTKDGNARYKWSKENYYHAILVMNRIGTRVAEMKNLTWEDINRTGGRTRIKFQGKAKQRTILVPDAVAEYFERLRTIKKSLGSVWNWNEEDFPYVFGQWKTGNKNGHWDSTLRMKWMRASGVKNPDSFKYGCFRHTFITTALNRGVNSLEIALYCGTSQLMIEKTYQHLVSDKVAELVFKGVDEKALAGKGQLNKFMEDYIEDD